MAHRCRAPPSTRSARGCHSFDSSTPGYFDDDDATAAALVDGWLKTGDLARIDDEGYVYLLDRKKDVITRGGFKIYSVELEYTLLSHPAIDQAAAFGLPDTLVFEQVAVFIVPAPDRTITSREIRRHVADRMADYAVPHYIRIVTTLPRNRTGKVVKTDLRALLLAELERGTP